MCKFHYIVKNLILQEWRVSHRQIEENGVSYLEIMKAFTTQRRFSFEDRKKIESLVKQGFNKFQIAKAMGRANSGIRSEMKRCLNWENYTAQEAENHRIKIEMARRKKLGKRVTILADEILKALKEGMQQKQICERFGVSASGVCRIRKAAGLPGTGEEYQSLETKLFSLQMQLEIILERIDSLEKNERRP